MKTMINFKETYSFVIKQFIIFVILNLILITKAGIPNRNNYNEENHFHRFEFDNIKPVKWNDETTRQCGYQGCPVLKANMLNVHIVPHTHDDVGWLKTVDQYYYGSKGLIQKAGVQYILDSVIQSLLSDPEKRFIYVESAFFFKWWKEQTPELQEQVKMLVNEGRLEFIGGAWTMNDEATVYYQSVIDQFTYGLNLLNQTFGECGRPRIGWQIDPFGHTSEMASMFAQMGYDGLFIGRLDYQDKAKRMMTKTPEMIWKSSSNLGDKANLFTGVLYNNYGPPPGFCFDILCDDEPIIDSKWSPDNNVERRVNSFIQYVNEMARHYKSNNIILTMGEDFNYQDANVWYKNLDKLIFYVNARQENGSEINMFYSTPSCYLKSLHDSDLTWPIKTDDFVPYASDPHTFWSGYFTSRPSLKRFERIGNHFLQICKQLTVASTSNNQHKYSHLSFMHQEMGIMQHHDAVAGTEKQHVANDYVRRLTVAIRACGVTAHEVLNQLAIGTSTEIKSNFEFENCLGLNISQCVVSEQSSKFIITLYNPLSHSTFEYIRIPVSDQRYTVLDYRNIPVNYQIVPISDEIKNLQLGQSKAMFELIFLAEEIPPLGYKSYFITHDEKTPQVFSMSDTISTVPKQSPTNNNNDNDEIIEIGNENVQLTFNKQSGELVEITTNGIKSKIRQEFFYYESAQGDNEEFKNRSSGAYIFRPNSTEKIISDKIKISVERGSIVDEVHQIFNNWISQIIRIYKTDNHVEFEWLVGPIPIDDDVGKEVVTRFYTDIKSNKIFYTDSNGREMIRRVRNHRDTWDFVTLEPISGNYYPVTAKIAIEDDDKRLAILTDRAQGGSSLQDGNIELMIHRRTLKDDAFGVGEALNETEYGHGLIVRGKHWLKFSKKTKTTPTPEADERFLQLQKLLPSWIFFSDATKLSYDEWQTQFTNIYSAMTLSLPKNVNLLTFQPWNDNSLLIRFEHIMEKNDDPENYSKKVTFNLIDSFRDLQVSTIRETTLAGNQWLDESKRFVFKEDEKENIKNQQHHGSHSGIMKMTINLNPYASQSYRINEINENINLDNVVDDEFLIELQPMQIRTFVLGFDQ